MRHSLEISNGILRAHRGAIGPYYFTKITRFQWHDRVGDGIETISVNLPTSSSPHLGRTAGFFVAIIILGLAACSRRPDQAQTPPPPESQKGPQPSPQISRASNPAPVAGAATTPTRMVLPPPPPPIASEPRLQKYGWSDQRPKEIAEADARRREALATFEAFRKKQAEAAKGAPSGSATK